MPLHFGVSLCGAQPVPPSFAPPFPANADDAPLVAERLRTAVFCEREGLGSMKMFCIGELLRSPGQVNRRQCNCCAWGLCWGRYTMRGAVDGLEIGALLSEDRGGVACVADGIGGIWGRETVGIKGERPP